MNMQLEKRYIKRHKSSKKTHLNHAFAHKLSWKQVRDEINKTAEIKVSSIMTTRQEFIGAMEKMAEHVMKHFLLLENYTKEDITKLAVSEDFNQMVYEVLFLKYNKKK